MNVLAKFRNIELQYDICKVKGTLKLVKMASVHALLWIPDDFLEVTSSKFDPTHFRVGLFLYQINSITFCFSNFKNPTMQICFADHESFPQLVFLNNGQLAVKILIEFLTDNKFAISSSDDTYTIQYPYLPHQNLPPNFIHSSRFLSYIKHSQVLSHFDFFAQISDLSPIQMPQFNSYFNSNGQFTDFDNFKKGVLNCGLDPSVRPFAYDFLLGVYPSQSTKQERFAIQNQRFIEYSRLAKIWESRTSLQKSQLRNRASSYNTILTFSMPKKIILSTQGNQSEYYEIDAPKVGFVNMERILQCYALFNGDIHIYSCLADFLFRIILLYLPTNFETFNEITIDLFDGTKATQMEAESFVFWRLVIFLESTHHDQYFMGLKNDRASFETERIAGIIKTIDNAMSVWMDLKGISNLIFLRQSLFLMYDGSVNDTFALWDALISSPPEMQLLRTFSVAFLMLLYTFHEDETNMIDVINKMKFSINVKNLIKMAIKISDEIGKQTELGWLMMPYTIQKSQYIQNQQYDPNYNPKFLIFS